MAKSESKYITAAQARNVIDAATFACLSEMPLNRVLDFNLRNLKVRPQEFASRFCKLAGDWFGTHKGDWCGKKNTGHPNVWIWFMENPARSDRNMHLLYFVDPRLKKAFIARQKSWTKRAGGQWEHGGLKSKPFTKGYELHYRGSQEGAHLVGLEFAISYRLKGAAKDVCDVLQIEHHDQGRVAGKRVGIAQSINRKSRRKAKYRPPKGTRTILFKHRYLLEPGPPPQPENEFATPRMIERGLS